MTRSEEIVIAKLEEKHGNVQAVARELDVSDEYVGRIKRANENPIVKMGEETVVLLKPDLERVVGLRSTVSDYLTASMTDGKMSVREALSLLQIVLQYELNQRGLTAPRLTVNDNRTQTFTALVDALQTIKDPNVLRELMGHAQQPDIIVEETNEES